MTERHAANVIALHPQPAPSSKSEIGRLIGWSEETGFQVELANGCRSCIGTTVALDRLTMQRAIARGQRVLVTALDSGASIIAGFVHTLDDELDPSEVVVHVDGDRLVLQGRKEIELRCGQSSIVLRSSGELELRGEKIVSRARGANIVTGGSIRLN